MKRLLVFAVTCLASAAAVATVNINTAQQSELQRVKGLDKLAAKRIIEYRAQYGEYDTIDDLGKILTQDTVAKIRPQVAVSGDPYVPPPKPEKKKSKK